MDKIELIIGKISPAGGEEETKKTEISGEEKREAVIDRITDMLEEISPDDDFMNALKVLKACRKLDKLSRKIVDLCGTPAAPRLDAAEEAREVLCTAIYGLQTFVEKLEKQQ